mgnify:FL=1
MIINDPVFGFIEIPEGLLAQLARHPIMIRLTRLKQLGATHYVYPGAVHTRFGHSIGAYHLVTEALGTLEKKGVVITKEERLGTQIAMLLHDIGHGPMSHALENTLVKDVEHETISLLLMQRLNQETGGQLETAISIFKDQHPKHFLHELICSQLDMDRLDYLCRDSFFAGIREGTIGVARIIKMLDVRNDRLVIDHKGIYTIENYLMARRLMYWQVYLHKTAMAAQEVLRMTVERAKDLMRKGLKLPCTPQLAYFLQSDITAKAMDNQPQWADRFTAIDDSDMENAIKQWTTCEDKVLALLASDYIDRHLFKSKELTGPITDRALNQLRRQMASHLGISEQEASYLVRYKETDQMLYSSDDEHICISFKDGTTRDISECSELLKSNLTDKKSKRYNLYYQRSPLQIPADFCLPE